MTLHITRVVFALCCGMVAGAVFWVVGIFLSLIAGLIFHYYAPTIGGIVAMFCIFVLPALGFLGGTYVGYQRVSKESPHKASGFALCAVIVVSILGYLSWRSVQHHHAKTLEEDAVRKTQESNLQDFIQALPKVQSVLALIRPDRSGFDFTMSFEGNRDGKFLLTYAIEERHHGERFIEEKEEIFIPAGTSLKSIFISYEKLTRTYHQRALQNTSGKIWIKENFLFMFLLRPLLTSTEVSRLPWEKVHNLNLEVTQSRWEGPHSELSTKAKVEFAVDFGFNHGRAEIRGKE